MTRLKHTPLFLADLILVLLLLNSLHYNAAFAETAAAEDTEQAHEEDAHEGHDDEGVVKLNPQARVEFGIEVGEATGGDLAEYTRLPGEVVIDPDRLVHVVPRVSGVAQRVQKKLGDKVKAGDVLAVLESRELAEVKSAYLVARERFRLAETTYTREEKLWRETISSERDYLAAKQNLAELRIEMRATEQKLHALGFTHEYLKTLTFDEDEHFTHYEIRAPFDGTVIEKHISLGEVLKDDAEAFVIADLRSVWVNLTVYQKDLSAIQLGQTVEITAEDRPVVSGIISYVSPVVNEETRTAVARLVIDNTRGQWRPGSFITGLVALDARPVDLLVPRSALQTVDGETVVFVETAEGFEPQGVRVGRSNEVYAEIVHGLTPGQRYVAQGGFTLKAQLAKGSFGDGHGH